MEDAYRDIEDYGIIGDLHSVALVSKIGSIDWFCYPHFNSPSVFAAILDRKKGGHFRIWADDATNKQLYLPDTNVLITRFLTPDGVGEVADYMPIDPTPEDRRLHRVLRCVGSVRGEVPFHLECRPAFDYARAPHELELFEEGALFRSDGLMMALGTRVPLEEDGTGVRADFTMREGQRMAFVFEGVKSVDGRASWPMDEKEHAQTFLDTVKFWRDWLGSSTYHGRWRERVHRSALALKLLTFEPTGAIVAAPTSSLPERIGGERNWDYRYTWIRDAAFTVYALLRIGFTEEARAFMNWLLGRTMEFGPDAPLQPLYGIEGEGAIEEVILSHLEGYRGSQPVRVGNAATGQLQLDIYGALMDAVYLFNKYGTPISHDLWVNLRRILNWLCDNWQRPDQGIWEVRSEVEQFVYSKMMCWLALDRGIRIAEKRGLPADLERWREKRDAIYEEVMAKGWSEERQAFVQAYGSTALDASSLLMPLVFFVSPMDPRMLLTLEAIQEELVSDNLVRRYSLGRSQDGLTGEEGTFSLCTFWLVEALTRAGRVDEARLIFEKMLGYANHLGLYAEEIGPQGDALGNFPQAFTHLAMISAAVNLDRALGNRN